jgi:NAD(P)-dependent dehydrogenase (short-subunit alcohol dehydrogenase family)
MKALQNAGIETLTLDVLSEESIAASVIQVRTLLKGRLDILVNNAGMAYYAPAAEMDVAEAKKLFDLNVWSCISVTQAFLPLLLQSKSGGMVVNNSSGSSVISTPFMSLYGASKAALSMLTRGLHTELAAFGIRAIDLKPGSTTSNIYKNSALIHDYPIKENSLYFAAKEWLDKFFSGDVLMAGNVPQEAWAKATVAKILQRKTPLTIWGGAYQWQIWLGSYLPYSWQDWLGKDIARIPHVERCIKDYGKDKAVVDRFGPEAIVEN